MIENQTKISSNNLGTLAICAVRYSLDRLTYMPDEVSLIIRNNINEFDTSDLIIIKRTIEDWNSSLAPNKRYENCLTWVKLRDDIQEELYSRYR